jgi:HKD family nuclease
MKRPSLISLLTQAPGGSIYGFERLNALLKSPGLKRFRAAVAYARWDGLGLIAPNVEELLKAGGEFQALYGVGNGVTTPDSLLYSLYLQKLYSTHTYAGAVEDEYSNATFHPKFLEFRFADKTVAVVGSANLTGGGLIRNTELGLEVEGGRGTPLEKALDKVWTLMKAASEEISLELIRDLAKNRELGSEHDFTEGAGSKSGKPRLETGVKPSAKPLFAKVLDLRDGKKKAAILAELDPLTQKPETLYLQILPGETGSPDGSVPGYQIQLPVATLGPFFSVGLDQTKHVSFRFGDETFTVNMTHFENNTHRVRLRPLRDIERPAIVIFRRAGEDEYHCSVADGRDYARLLAEKCSEQTRAGARRWGVE